MKTTTIARRIFLTSGLLCLVIGALSTFAILRLYAISDVSHYIVDESLPGLIGATKASQDVTANFIRTDRLMRLSTNEAVKVESDIAVTAAHFDKVLIEFEKTVKSDEARRLFTAITNRLAEYRPMRQQYMTLLRSNPAEAATCFDEKVLPTYNAFAAAANDLFEYECKQSESGGKKIITDVKNAILFLAIFAGASLLTGILISFISVHRIRTILASVTSALQVSAAQVKSASNEVAAASQGLAEGASEQAASVEETSSSLEEISSMTKRNAESAQKAKDLSGETNIAADTGAADVARMNVAMEAIRASSAEVAKIIKTIDEIAFQTNILALNAAVEAARAGEAGMGFAVVADEVRNLAQRSASAAKETAEKIETAIASSNQGVEISAKVAGGLREIVEKVHGVNSLVSEVAASSHEQSQGIDQINTAVSQVDKVTQNNAANAEQSAAAAEELSAQATAMGEAVAQLAALAGTHSAYEGGSADAGSTATASRTYKPSASSAVIHAPRHNFKNAPASSWQAPKHSKSVSSNDDFENS